MNIATSAIVGVVFLLLGSAATFLMYYLWGFPFDKATRTSQAPKRLMRLHRMLGYTYGGIYLYMMIQMLPRMWQSQAELSPRTVAHLLLGFLIGIILLLKIAIMRFFRHFEEWMPYLGTLLFICTALLLGLSLPSAFHAGIQSRANRAQTQKQIFRAPKQPGIKSASEAEFVRTQAVFQQICSQCHAASRVDIAPPHSEADVQYLLQRMSGNGMKVTDSEMRSLQAYLMKIYVKSP